MNFSFTLLAVAGLCAASSLQSQTPDAARLGADVQKLFAAKCGACHRAGADQEESPHLVDNLAVLNDSEFINKDKAEDSKLYTLLVNGKMPKTTREERAAGKKAVPLTPDETQLVLEWIKASASASSTGSSAVWGSPQFREDTLRSFGPAIPPVTIAAPQQPTAAETPRSSTASRAWPAMTRA